MRRNQASGTANFGQSLVCYTAAVGLLFLSGCQRSAPPKPPGVSAPVVGVPDTVEEDVPPGEADSGDKTPHEVTDVTVPSTNIPSKGGEQLFARHCANCHGAKGDGQGIAARFLFPKPRDLRAGRFRLSNSVPSRDDLHSVLTRGMPGSSMPPWGHLSQADRDALVDEVMRLRRAGAREYYIAMLKEQDELTDEEIAEEDTQAEIQEYVDDFSTPGESSVVPEFSAPTDETIARGKEVYTTAGCLQCHGKEGKGDGAKEMIDAENLPTRPRDFTVGIFKGGHDLASLYRRTAYGMPGTPMPSSANLTTEQMEYLIHYIRSMSTEQQRLAAILNRETIVAKSVDTIPVDSQADAWADAEPVSLRMAPLWWRDNSDPDLTVQAVHDGEQLAVRVSWRDESADQHAARSESFEDAVAMELYQGDAEPFIGMGSSDVPIDVWFWDADRQGDPVTVEDTYPNTVVDLFPLSEKVVASAELDRDGARAADQPDISLPARAVGNPIVPTSGASGASSLTADGPGSLTFRIPKSPLVAAWGEWADGRWTVVMTRSLSVESAADGISLPADGKTSVAFAVWDGSQKDRDGKKLITIWQDLVLEKK